MLDPDTTLEGAYSSWVYNYRLLLQNGAPNQIEVWNNPALAKVVTHYGDAYFMDSWTMARRLTLNLGLRYAHDNGFVPEICREAAAPPGNLAFPAGCRERQQFNVWDSFAPRMHASYDISGDGKTLVKGGWGRFDHERQQVPELDAADAMVRTQVVYRWRDLNGNGRYDIGEVNLDPLGGRLRFSERRVQHLSEHGRAATEERRVLDFVRTRADGELLGARERYLFEVSRHVSAAERAAPVRGLQHSGDETGSGARWHPEQCRRHGSVVHLLRVLDRALQPRSFEHFVRINDPNADQTYKSLDIAFFKRLSNNWQLLASYSGTMRDVPISVSATGSEFNGNVESGPMNPNGEINTHEHGWESSTKVSGVYRFPWDIMASGQWELRSGYFWARSVRFTGGRTIPNITINVEPRRLTPAPRQQSARPARREDLQSWQGAEICGAGERVQRAEREHRVGRDAPVGTELQQADGDHGTADHGVLDDVFVLTLTVAVLNCRLSIW